MPFMPEIMLAYWVKDYEWDLGCVCFRPGTGRVWRAWPACTWTQWKYCWKLWARAREGELEGRRAGGLQSDPKHKSKTERKKRTGEMSRIRVTTGTGSWYQPTVDRAVHRSRRGREVGRYVCTTMKKTAFTKKCLLVSRLIFVFWTTAVPGTRQTDQPERMRTCKLRSRERYWIAIYWDYSNNTCCKKALDSCVFAAPFLIWKHGSCLQIPHSTYFQVVCTFFFIFG